MGFVRLFESRFQEAERVFTQLLARGKSMRVFLGRAMARLSLKDYEGAAQDASEVLARSPETEAYLLRGSALSALRKDDLARRDFEAVLQQGSPRQQARARAALAELARRRR